MADDTTRIKAVVMMGGDPLKEEGPMRERDMDDKQLRAVRLQNALLLQRKHRLAALVAKRAANVAYLQTVHEGGVFWLNCALLTERDIGVYVKNIVPQQRATSFYYLALSLSKLLDPEASPNVARGVQLVRAFVQLFEECDYHFSGTATQSVKSLTARTSTCIYPALSSSSSSSDGRVWKFDGAVVYEHLLVPHLPFDVDYVQVFPVLSSSLINMYESFKHPECYATPSTYDMVLRIDSKIKDIVINVIAKELTELCQAAIKDSIEGLRGNSVPSFPSLSR